MGLKLSSLFYRNSAPSGRRLSVKDGVPQPCAARETCDILEKLET